MIATLWMGQNNDKPTAITVFGAGSSSVCFMVNYIMICYWKAYSIWGSLCLFSWENVFWLDWHTKYMLWMETMFQNRTTLILNTRVPENEEKEDRSTLPSAVSLADVHVGSPDKLGGKVKSQKISRLFPLHRNSRSSRFGEKSSGILTSSLSNPADTTASPMTSLKSSKATTPVSLMFKHSLSSSKNKRKQSRGHGRTTGEWRG